MTLVDTSVWIDHFRVADARLTKLLSSRRALMHSFVLGELACGNLPRRAGLMAGFQKLPLAQMAEESDVRYLLESHRLWGLGLGWIDLHLLTSATISGSNLLTSDHALMMAARKLGVAYPVN